MTDARDHRFWQELVAAQAVHALEPAEDAQLTEHLAGCTACQRTLDDYTLVAAQLGSLSSDTERAPAWATIRSQLDLRPAAPRALTAVADAKRPRHRHGRPGSARLLAAAAAVTILAAGGVAGGLLEHRGGQPATTSAAACRIEPGCHLVALHGQSNQLATVLVSNGQARLVPLRMKSSAANKTYVLWQLPRDGGPIPLMEFRIPSASMPTGALSRSYADTAAFAVSVEPVAYLPAHPTVILATGAAGA